MKKLIGVFVCVVALFSSCSTNFDLTSNWKEITIVYGLLNVQDTTAHYIRIEKAYLDSKTSAIQIASNPDSIYYGSELDVKIKEINSNGGEDGEVTLDRINGNDYGLPKDSGQFASTENILYRFSGPLKSDHSYQLVITNNKTGNSVQSSTPMVNDFQFLFPTAGFTWNPASTSPLNIQWRSALNGKVYDLVVRFHYYEWLKTDTLQTNKVAKTVEVVLATNVKSTNTDGTQTMQQKLDGSDFYKELASKIPVDPLVQREVASPAVDFHVNAGAEALYNYMRVNVAQLGITSQQALNSYTNIENGLGIFSSRFFKVQTGINLSANAKDSLACGHITLGLGFLRANGQDFCQ